MRAFFRFVGRVFFCLALLALLWLAGLAWFVMQIPLQPAADGVKTDAIVVLTGGRGRIEYGMQLLAEGRAGKLFITGVESADSARYLAALVSKDLSEKIEQGGALVALGMDARNTIGNAQETAQWVRKENLASLRLVTTNYHIPRALAEFRFAMPKVAMVPDAVVSEGVDVNQWWRFGSPSSQMVLSEYHKLLAAWARHVIIRFREDQREPIILG